MLFFLFSIKYTILKAETAETFVDLISMQNSKINISPPWKFDLYLHPIIEISHPCNQNKPNNFFFKFRNFSQNKVEKLSKFYVKRWK